MSADLPEEAYAAALAMSPAVGPATLRSLLSEDPPSLAWARAAATESGSEDAVAKLWDRHRARHHGHAGGAPCISEAARRGPAGTGGPLLPG